MSDTEIRMMRYTIEQLSAELQEIRQYVSDIETKLDRTKKQLEIANDTLRHADWFFDGDYNVYTKDMHKEIKYAIKAISNIADYGQPITKGGDNAK